LLAVDRFWPVEITMPFLLGTEEVTGSWSSDGERFTLSKPILYRSLAYDTHRGEPIRVPVGFVTDFASSWVGRFQLLSRKAAFSASPVLHDWLYYEGLENKEVADLIFKEALQSQGCSSYDVWKAYWGVRWFGKAAWESHRERDWTKKWRRKLK